MNRIATPELPAAAPVAPRLGAAESDGQRRHPRLLRFARHSTDALADNKQHDYAHRFAISLYASQAIYSFIPKNACSTMRLSVAYANGAITGPADFHWIHANNETFMPTLRDLATARYTFVVLRDPFHRLVSCFLDKMVTGQIKPNFFSKPVGEAMTEDTLTFRKFVIGVKKRLNANGHWKPQTAFLVYEDYDDWFAVEDFGRAVTTLERRIGLEVLDARPISQHGKDRHQPVDDRSHADTPVAEIAAMKARRELPAFPTMFDDEIIAAVRSLYAEDIALYQHRIGLACAF